MSTISNWAFTKLCRTGQSVVLGDFRRRVQIRTDAFYPFVAKDFLALISVRGGGKKAGRKEKAARETRRDGAQGRERAGLKSGSSGVLTPPDCLLEPTVRP
jgi:hypothetical protein